MNSVLNKLRKLEMSMASERGAFDLFVLLAREEVPNKWDLLAAASWVEENYNESLNYFSRKLIALLTEDELLTIAKVVLLDETAPLVQTLHKAIAVEHGLIEIRENNFFGHRIEQAYVITSKRQPIVFRKNERRSA